MIRSTILQAAFASGIGLLGSAIALSTPDSPQNAPLAEVPSAANEIVVIGKRPPRCRPLASDPQDAVDLSSPPQARSVAIQRDPATGDFELVQDTFPMLGPDTWQRAGAGLDEFVFRAPDNGDPVCIGRKRWGGGSAQLRRAFSAEAFRGHYVVLSAYVAARNASEVEMWVVAGANNPRKLDYERLNRDIVAGGFKPVRIKGDYRWRQVNLLMGPVPCMATQISYGIQLAGRGDVWLADPQFVIVPEEKLSPSMRGLPYGEQMLATDPICRFMNREGPLFVRTPATDDQPAGRRKLRYGAPIYPGMVLYGHEEEGDAIAYDGGLLPGWSNSDPAPRPSRAQMAGQRTASSLASPLCCTCEG